MMRDTTQLETARMEHPPRTIEDRVKSIYMRCLARLGDRQWTPEQRDAELRAVTEELRGSVRVAIEEEREACAEIAAARVEADDAGPLGCVALEIHDAIRARGNKR